jgi:hypothetical protein
MQRPSGEFVQIALGDPGASENGIETNPRGCVVRSMPPTLLCAGSCWVEAPGRGLRGFFLEHGSGSDGSSRRGR